MNIAAIILTCLGTCRRVWSADRVAKATLTSAVPSYTIPGAGKKTRTFSHLSGVSERPANFQASKISKPDPGPRQHNAPSSSGLMDSDALAKAFAESRKNLAATDEALGIQSVVMWSGDEADTSDDDYGEDDSKTTNSSGEGITKGQPAGSNHLPTIVHEISELEEEDDDDEEEDTFDDANLQTSELSSLASSFVIDPSDVALGPTSNSLGGIIEEGDEEEEEDDDDDEP